MKKFIVILLGLLILNGCNPAPTPLSIPIHTSSPLPTFTPSPVPTSTPTPTPFLHVNKRSPLTFNAMASVPPANNTTGMWFVGDDGLIAHESTSGYPLEIDSPFREHLYDVDFISADNGWIVGANSLILHWDGMEWSVSKPAVDSRWPYSYDLYSVAFHASNDGWAAGCTGSEGGQYFLVYHWDGTAWSEVSLSDERNLWACVNDIVALSSDDVWMVGTGWNEGKEHGVTVHWDGSTWKLFSELQSYNIHSLSALSPENIWAITGNSVVLHWNGVEWQEGVHLDSANMIFAQDSDDVFAIGTKIWYWNGSVWTELSLSSNFPADVDIKSVLAPYKAESGYFNLWMLDSSGMIYTFSHPRSLRR